MGIIRHRKRRIITLLKNEKMSAGHIAEELNITPAALSYHLKKLKSAQLIYETKYKNYVYYELDTTVFDDILLWMVELKGGNKK
ncbi:MAG: ArsR family transcriptional regulator [Lachnotalea sp.]